MKYADDNQDDVLLQTLTQTVLFNLENEQFSVEDLSEQIGMSRSHLHRKLKLLKGQSVSQFIREVRLKEAMKLLQNNAGNISEIAYRVGFGSNTYFNRCFVEHYGYSPGEVKKRMPEENNRPASSIDGIEEKTPDPADQAVSPEIETANQQTRLSTRKPKILLLVALVLVFLLVAGYYFYPTQSEPIAAMPKAIAVLPLDNLTGDPEQDYLAAGIHDALIGELGKISGLRVISKTSTLPYPKREMRMQEIARELGVDVIVEGSVFVAGDSLRIQIQLISPYPEETHLLSQEYYQDIRQVLALQNNVIRDIAREIQVNLTPEEETKLASARTVNPETYKAYLRGMYYLDKSTAVDRQKGLAYLHQAVDNDPADPLAYAGLALGYINIAHSAPSSQDALIKAKAAARRALQLDSTLVELHAALGEIYLYNDWNWEAAEKTFKYVNKLNPSMAINHYHYAWYLNLVGREEEAIREHELAARLDPLGPKNTAWLAWLYAFYGEFQLAEVEARKAQALDANYDITIWAWGLIYLQQEKFDEAIAMYAQLVEKYPHYGWLLGCAYAKSGQIDKARSILNDWEQKPLTPWNAIGLAGIYACLGEKDKAFECLSYKFDAPLPVFPWIRENINFYALRDDPRFNELLATLNLPPVPTPSNDNL